MVHFYGWTEHPALVTSRQRYKEKRKQTKLSVKSEYAICDEKNPIFFILFYFNIII